MPLNGSSVPGACEPLPPPDAPSPDDPAPRLEGSPGGDLRVGAGRSGSLRLLRVVVCPSASGASLEPRVDAVALAGLVHDTSRPAGRPSGTQPVPTAPPAPSS